MTEKQIEEKAIAYARKVFLENNGDKGDGFDFNPLDVLAYMEGYKDGHSIDEPTLDIYARFFTNRYENDYVYLEKLFLLESIYRKVYEENKKRSFAEGQEIAYKHILKMFIDELK